MRALIVAGLVAAYGFAATAALSQTAPSNAGAAPPAPAPSGAAASPGRSGAMTRDEYVQRAVDRARRAAEARFDKMDSNHDGVLTADERRAARSQRGSPKPGSQ
jgi:hypothetical protein